MQSIRLITFHTPKNYGAVLQAYSLMSYLQNFSNDVKIIDYNTEHLRNLYPILPKTTTFFGKLKTIFLFFKTPKIREKRRKFNDFYCNKLLRTKRFPDTESLYEERWNDIIFITGSDQVFNPNRILDERKAFFLDFVPSKCKRISYAASFGVTEISKEKQSEIKGYLSKMNMISVREHSGCKIVEDLLGLSPDIVLDPVFLNDKNFWINEAQNYEKSYNNYVIYYRLVNDFASDSIAKEIANKKQLKLIIVTGDVPLVKSDAVLYDVGPQEFLFLMQNADFVVTNSFHGVAFSILFEKQFVYTDTGKRNNRALELMKSLGIESKAYCENYSINNWIDYEVVTKKLKILIDSSKCFIRRALEISTQKDKEYVL